MQNQLSTATPDVASLPTGGYLMESTPPESPHPIDPPDNQGGGNMTSPDPEEEEEEPSGS